MKPQRLSEQHFQNLQNLSLVSEKKFNQEGKNGLAAADEDDV